MRTAVISVVVAVMTGIAAVILTLAAVLPVTFDGTVSVVNADGSKVCVDERCGRLFKSDARAVAVGDSIRVSIVSIDGEDVFVLHQKQ